jgi:hypothetical protein
MKVKYFINKQLCCSNDFKMLLGIIYICHYFAQLYLFYKYNILIVTSTMMYYVLKVKIIVFMEEKKMVFW